jgi:hypothetical protein
MIAVDSSVLVDVSLPTRFADSSEASLGRALAEGDVVICDAVVAEIHLLEGAEATMESLASLGIRYLPTSEPAAVRRRLHAAALSRPRRAP